MLDVSSVDMQKQLNNKLNNKLECQVSLFFVKNTHRISKMNYGVISHAIAIPSKDGLVSSAIATEDLVIL
jgi:hypothetical protein